MSTITLFIVTICVILLMLNVLQLLRSRSRSRHLRFIAHTVQRLTKEQTGERVKLMTSDRDLRQLLVAINRLLDEKQKSQVHFQRQEMKIRKMLANVSHDMKTPLTVILGYTETLLQEQRQAESPNRSEPRLENIHHKCKEILELIQQFFDLARLESGDHELVMQKIAINEVCKERMLSFYDLIQAESLQIELDIPPRPLYIMADIKALERILDNLISNAIRYGKDGHIVGLRLYTKERDVHVEVWDRGEGIQEKDKDKVFERSYRLDDARNRKVPGSGLGLTICKRLTEEMGGGIRLDSRPFVRTSFTLTFPLAEEVRIS